MYNLNQILLSVPTEHHAEFRYFRPHMKTITPQTLLMKYVQFSNKISHSVLQFLTRNLGMKVNENTGGNLSVL